MMPGVGFAAPVQAAWRRAPRWCRVTGKAALAVSVALVAAGGVGLALRTRWPPLHEVTGKELPQAAYLWQRQWNEPVRDAVTAAAGAESPFNELLVFGAEIAVAGTRGEAVNVTRAAGLDWGLLARSKRPIGLVVRVRGVRGAVGAEREPFPTLRALVDDLLAQARHAGLRLTEVQVDFDCPTSRLRGFAETLGALRRARPGERWTFTALPAWLRSAAFPALAKAADGYVLQVHAFDLAGAGGGAPATLCDPEAARKAVQRASRLGFPFRVALPTYAYRLVLDADGRLLAAAAEGAPLAQAQPPAGGSHRLLEADAVALGGLVAGWTKRRPGALTGAVWYRLPVPGLDRLNWPPATLAAVMAGRAPRAELRCEFSGGGSPGEGQGPVVREWELRNAGEASSSLPWALRMRCPREPMAMEGIGAYEVATSHAVPGGGWEVILWRRAENADRRVLPGAVLRCGWVRVEGGGEADGLTGEPVFE